MFNLLPEQFMQAKPLAITIIILAILAFAADTWLGKSTRASVVIEQGQVALSPGKILFQKDTLEVESYSLIQTEDTLETTQTVAQKLQDLTLTALIEKKLFRVKEFKGIGFDVASNKGVVALHGSVETEKDQQRAVRLVQRLSGVKSVENNIKVRQQKPATSASSSG